MSTIINYGFDKISEVQGLTVPDFKKDLYNGGWRYEASSPSNLSQIYLYQSTGSVSIKSKHLKNLFIKLKLNSNFYDDIPSIRIRTLPKGDGSDFDPLYHDSFTIKVNDNNLYEEDSILYFHYQGFPSDLQTEQNFEMFIISSEGTHDANLDIKDIFLFTEASATTDYNILEFNYRNAEDKHFNYLINFGSVNEGTNQIKINETLDSIKSNSDSMLTLTTANNKILEEENKDGYAQVMLYSSGCDAINVSSTIYPVADTENRQGWKYINKTGGTKYFLFYFNGAQESILQSELNSLYAKLFIDVNTGSNCIPHLHVYTKPKLDGSDAEPWYNSRWDYTIDLSSQHVGIGEEIVLYAINQPNKKFTNRLVELENVAINGPGTDGEVLYLNLSSDSGASTNDVNHCINLMGFDTTNLIQRNYNLFSHLVNEPLTRQYELNIVDNVAVLANADIGSVIDCGINKTINIYGTATANHNFYILQSADNVSFYLSEEASPTTFNTAYHFYTTINNCLRYIKLVNNNHNNTYTLNYSLL